jgi:hypothetical protein
VTTCRLNALASKAPTKAGCGFIDDKIILLASFCIWMVKLIRHYYHHIEAKEEGREVTLKAQYIA